LFVGNGVTQYFVPPEGSKNGKFDLNVDITFRNDAQLDEPAIVNFTLSSHGSSQGKTLSMPKSFAFVDFSGAKYPTTDLSMIYVDSEKHAVRMTATMERFVFLGFISADPALAEVVLDDDSSIVFPLNQNTKKNLHILHEEVSYNK
jgi:hypothetical protein